MPSTLRQSTCSRVPAATYSSVVRLTVSSLSSYRSSTSTSSLSTVISRFGVEAPRIVVQASAARGGSV